MASSSTLREPVRMPRGHMNHIDTEWALTSISQVDVWRPGTMERLRPGAIRGIVSVDVSDWDAPAPATAARRPNTAAKRCVEVWRQLKRSVNVAGEEPRFCATKTSSAGSSTRTSTAIPTTRDA